MKASERFLNYVKYDTKSDENTGITPSTEGQRVFAKALAEEMKSIGLKDVTVDENAYVMGTLPSNTDKEVCTIGLIAHLDTSPDISGKDVKPQVVKNYDGKDIILNKDLDIVLSPKDFPELKNYIGHDLITTDGTTLLGADDKAGVAEIMTVVEYLKDHPEIKHGAIAVGFTPDEEIGEGASKLDIEKFGAKYAYTVDGCREGELEFENFNAAAAKVIIHGRNIHPGSAKGKMVNSIFIANEFLEKLPKDEVPEKTEKYEGFYLLNSIEGSVEETTLHYIIRDFDKENFENRKNSMKKWAEEINAVHGEGTCDVEIKDQYSNMKEKVDPVHFIVDIAFEAMKNADIVPQIVPIRGGTDGAQLSFRGLPTPNMFTGGENCHGKYEFASINSMNKAVETMLNIVKLYEEKGIK